MKALIYLIIIFWVSMVSADPFVVSDPQAGIEEHRFECASEGYNVVTIAQPDGSFMWDFELWSSGHGWFDCTVRARIKYEVTDVATSITTEVIDESDPANVRIKVPNRGSNAGYKVE